LSRDNIRRVGGGDVTAVVEARWGLLWCLVDDVVALVVVVATAAAADLTCL